MKKIIFVFLFLNSLIFACNSVNTAGFSFVSSFAQARSISNSFGVSLPNPPSVHYTSSGCWNNLPSPNFNGGLLVVDSSGMVAFYGQYNASQHLYNSLSSYNNNYLCSSLYPPYHLSSDGTQCLRNCPTGQTLSSSGQCLVPIPTCPANQHYDSNTSQCVPNCPAGQVQNSNSVCCDTLGADTAYGVNQATCNSTPFAKIDNITFLSNINWNTCLNECVGTSSKCPKGKAFDSNGNCVVPYLDPSSCQAQGGTLVNRKITGPLAVIPGPGYDQCFYSADCKLADNSIVTGVSVEVSCGDGNTTDTNTTTDLNVTIPLHTDSNICQTCPSQYPYSATPDTCSNNNGDIITCPTLNKSTNTTIPSNITCGTCNTLSGNWLPSSNGFCKRTTINGVIQFVSCPSSQDTNATLSINTNPNINDINTTAPDINTSINQTSQNGNGTQTVCPSCPAGYTSIGGNCALVYSGQITSLIACPGQTANVDANGTSPLDNNGTDKNATSSLGQFGDTIQNQIKNAYQTHSFFNSSDCGSLQVTQSALLFGHVQITDPLPIFRDIMAPYRDLIKGFLLFIAVVIGLFDFFKRS